MQQVCKDQVASSLLFTARKGIHNSHKMKVNFKNMIISFVLYLATEIGNYLVRSFIWMMHGLSFI